MVTYLCTTSSNTNTTENNGKNSCDSSAGIDFCPFQLTPPINEYTYCALKRICRKIVKEICCEERKEVYSVFDGGKSLGYQPIGTKNLRGLNDHIVSSSFVQYHRPSSSSPQSAILKIDNPTKQLFERTSNNDIHSEMKKPISVKNIKRNLSKKKNLLETMQTNKKLPIILNLRQKVRQTEIAENRSIESQPAINQRTTKPTLQKQTLKPDYIPRKTKLQDSKSKNDARLGKMKSSILSQFIEQSTPPEDGTDDSFNGSITSQGRIKGVVNKFRHENLASEEKVGKNTNIYNANSKNTRIVDRSLNNQKSKLKPTRERALPFHKVRDSNPIQEPRVDIEKFSTRQTEKFGANQLKEKNQNNLGNTWKILLGGNEKNSHFNTSAIQQKMSRDKSVSAQSREVKKQRTIITKNNEGYGMRSQQLKGKMRHSEKPIPTKSALQNRNEKHLESRSRPLNKLDARPLPLKFNSRGDATKACDFLRAQMENRELCCRPLCSCEHTAPIKKCLNPNCRCEQSFIK